MKLKYLSIFIFLFLLICCASAVYAASDDNVLELDQSDDIISVSDVDLIADGESGDDPVGPGDDPSNPGDDPSNPGDDPSNPGENPSGDEPAGNGSDGNGTGDVPAGNGTGNASSGNASSGNSSSTSGGSSSSTVSSNTASVSSISAFNTALKNKKKTIYLTANLKITSSFSIRYNVVIDGKGHSIDAQKKTDIFSIGAYTVTIRNLILKNAKSSIGGAIYASGAKLNIKNCTFTGNKATDKGGAIYLYNGKLTIDGSTFQSNLATLNGGAIYTSTSTVNIKNSKFINNKVASSKSNGHGGAIHIYKKSSSITNTVFKNNTCLSTACKKHAQATKYQFGGGAIYYNLGSVHNLTKCKFTSNRATNHGGAVYGFKCDSLTMNKCALNSNKVSYEDGGAITFSGKKLVMKNSNFTKNNAYEDGGVMDACSQNKNNVAVTISGCIFKENTAYKGGGVFWMGVRSIFTISSSKFLSNKAGMGGALFAEKTTAKITSCLFQSNQAKKLTSWTVKTKDGRVLKHCGGVLRLQGKSVKFVKCTFKKNHATYGGVVFQTGGKLTMSSVKYSGNTAKSGPKIKKG